MIENREFASFDMEAKHLLGSVELALANPLYDLNDFSFIEGFVEKSIEETQNRLSFLGAYYVKITERLSFQISIAICIVLNTIFVYVEQNIREGKEEKDVGSDYWLGV